MVVSNPRLPAQIDDWLWIPTWQGRLVSGRDLDAGIHPQLERVRDGLIVPTDNDAYKYFVVHGEASPQYQRFSSAIYSVEHSIPALSLGVSSAWSANTQRITCGHE